MSFFFLFVGVLCAAAAFLFEYASELRGHGGVLDGICSMAGVFCDHPCWLAVAAAVAIALSLITKIAERTIGY